MPPIWNERLLPPDHWLKNTQIDHIGAQKENDQNNENDGNLENGID